jgi:hypothetical protein
MARDREGVPLPDVGPGKSLLLLEPAGDVPAVSQFRWQSSSFLDRFYVEVRDEGGIIYFATVPTTLIVVSADLQKKLVAGRYRWRVVARDATRAALVATPLQSFAIVASESDGRTAKGPRDFRLAALLLKTAASLAPPSIHGTLP